MTPRRARSFQAVSDAELQLLEELWKAPATPQELQAKLADAGSERAYTTVQTLLHRLLNKGFVARRRDGVAQVYSARVDRDELLARHVAALADRLCAGSVSPLVLSLVKTRRFSRGELARFKKLLEDERDGSK